jgi:hypothetical protein
MTSVDKHSIFQDLSKENRKKRASERSLGLNTEPQASRILVQEAAKDLGICEVALRKQLKDVEYVKHFFV